ncbi:MAG: ABC transporter substrate-binding protein [Acidimicrobiia bacterium]|nr:ABC transporter substrate-binding protein [Acidimicrobiia bacterium]
MRSTNRSSADRGLARLAAGAGALVLLLAAGDAAFVAARQGGDPPPAAAEPATLPDGIVWETNSDDPPIGSEAALRGGTFTHPMGSYPLTFRLVGPNSNDAFAGWNRAFTMNFGLIGRHPVTDRFIPLMATHWSVQADQKTIYFRLDPDARFSDGEPITADDYVFTLEMMRSEHIVDPFYNNYAELYYESVDRIDDYTLRIVGTRPSWRPLSDYAGLWPTPSHAVVLDDTWVDRTTNEFQIAVGPYVVSEVSRGESVTFTRLGTWWGDDKRYFRGLFNFDRIHLPVIPAERHLDYLRRGEIDLISEPTARTWNEEYTFPAVRNGWIRLARVFVDVPSGVYGLHMNLEAPIFRNKDFRKAMQHLFNFERLNRNLMFNEYFRQVSFFEGTEFANPDLAPYAFDPARARMYLERAGYYRPDDIRNRTLFGGLRSAISGLLFTRSDTDDILVNDRGEEASFAVVYGNRGLERHLTVMQQEYRRAGVDMRLRLLEPGTAFERGLERKYEMTVTGRTAGYYPAPRQYLHTDFKKTTNNNNIWGFGTEETDALIRTYEEDLDAQARLTAMNRLDEIVHDEAFYIPFWMAPYIRLAYWDYIQFPEFHLPRRTEQVLDYMVFWIDPAKKTALEEAMREGRAYPVDPDIDKDFYGIRQQIQ